MCVLKGCVLMGIIFHFMWDIRKKLKIKLSFIYKDRSEDQFFVCLCFLLQVLCCKIDENK